jgi:hypothetical protein
MPSIPAALDNASSHLAVQLMDDVLTPIPIDM